ncbi:hypothetical protein COLO4_29500 [Corchorus olitorius]|uniref:Uncharacterized protein n=1 Tax=Corchorus olitorius TaxID=93759 RepID=A0A1R3HEB1_9ROSI|nr:hypothetical protein COLO4_29500 [Corchorus olitorius]
MAVFAVSGSIVFIAREVHKRTTKCHQMKKRVRFADDVMEPSSNNKEYRKRNSLQGKLHNHNKVLQMEESSMPLNRQVLYKGILEYKTLKSNHI